MGRRSRTVFWRHVNSRNLLAGARVVAAVGVVFGYEFLQGRGHRICIDDSDVLTESDCNLFDADHTSQDAL